MLSVRGRDFLTMQEYSVDELELFLKTAEELKQALLAGQKCELLQGKVLAMVFQKPSTRTRVSFEVAMKQLGGHALYLSWNELQLGRGETIGDTARVLSRYAHGIMARVFTHSDTEEMAKHAPVPVINGLSDLHHPCQGLADLLTIREHKGDFKGLKLAWVGDGNNVCNSLLIGCSKFGIDISVACPKGYAPSKTVLGWAKQNAGKNGSKIKITTEPKEAAENADIVYTDTFISMGTEDERKQRLKVFMPKYQVTPKLFKYAKKDVVFMHCLPAHRGEEVVDEVIDGSHSIVWDQAENRLHLQKALLALLL